jgi:hypothetical protein
MAAKKMEIKLTCSVILSSIAILLPTGYFPIKAKTTFFGGNIKITSYWNINVGNVTEPYHIIVQISTETDIYNAYKMLN